MRSFTLFLVFSALAGTAHAQAGLSTTLRSIFGGSPTTEPAPAAPKPADPGLSLKPAAIPAAAPLAVPAVPAALPAAAPATAPVAVPAATAPAAPAVAATPATPAPPPAPSAASPTVVALPSTPAPAGLSLLLLPASGAVTAQFADSAGQPAQVQVNIDDAALQNALIRFTLEPLYVRTGVPQWDTDLRSRPWFDPRGHAHASFVASGARQVAPGEYEAQGTLTMKGFARTVTARIRMTQSGAIRVVQGEIPFMRADFRLGEAHWSDPALMAANAAFRFRVESGTRND